MTKTAEKPYPHIPMDNICSQSKFNSDNKRQLRFHHVKIRTFTAGYERKEAHVHAVGVLVMTKTAETIPLGASHTYIAHTRGTPSCHLWGLTEDVFYEYLQSARGGCETEKGL